MNTAINPCDARRLIRYHDNELPAGERQAVADHLAQCSRCRRALAQQQHLRRFVQQAANGAAARTPRPDVESALLARIKNRGASPPATPRSWSPRRWAPAAALALATLVVTVIYNPWPEAVVSREPSAIVESFHGNVSTVMILQTQTTGQTIVWFNEISEPDGESDGNQSAPPAVDRSAHPAADRQRSVGRA